MFRARAPAPPRTSALSLHDALPISYISLQGDLIEVTQQGSDGFKVERIIAGFRSGFPSCYTFQEYSAAYRKHSSQENWLQLIREASSQEEQRRGLHDFSIDIQGGGQSACTTNL